MADYAYANVADPVIAGSMLSNGVDFQWFAVPAFCCLIVFWLMRDLLKAVLFERSKLPVLFPETIGSMTAYQREAFVMWIMQPLFGTIGVVLMFALSSDVLLYGTFQSSILNDEPDVRIDSSLMWTDSMARALTVWRWAFQPMVLLYLYEIVSVSPTRARTVSHQLLTFHHLLVILIAGWIFKAFSSTLNPVWAQTGFALYLHMTLEQHSWLSLIAYRLKLRGHEAMLMASVIVEIILRLLLWGFCFYVYAKLCWLTCGLTYFEAVFQVVFPICAVLMILAQSQIIRIHFSMAIGAMNKCRISGKHHQHRGSTEPTSSADSATNTSSTQELSTLADATPIAVAQSSSSSDPESPSVSVACSPTRPPPLSMEVNDSSQQNKLPGSRSMNHPEGEQRHADQRGSTMSLIELPPTALAIVVLVTFGLIFGAEIIRPNRGWVQLNCKRVAVVGGGAAGLAATYAMHRDGRFTVTLIERRNRLGGNAYSVTNGSYTGDMGAHLIHNYNNFESMLSDIGIDVQDDYGVGTVLEKQADGSLRTFNNFFPIEGIATTDYIGEIERLSKLVRTVKNTWSEAEMMTLTLKDFFVAHNFTDDFQNSIRYSLFAASAATASAPKLDLPIGLFALMDELTHLSTNSRQRQYRRLVRGGIYSYVQRLQQIFQTSPNVEVKLQTFPLAVRHSTFGKVQLLLGGRAYGGHPEWAEFDQVIFATPKDETLSMLTHPLSSKLPAEKVYRRVLGDGVITYDMPTTIAHVDSGAVERQFPQMKDRDGCWRLESRGSVYSEQTEQWAMGVRPPTGISYFDKCIRNLSGMVFVHANWGNVPDAVQPNPALVLEEQTWRHPSHTVAFYQSSRAGHAIQGLNQMWYAGAEAAGLNLHEPSITSGLVTANAVGAAYLYDGHDGARLFFLLMRGWLLHGNSYTVSAQGRKQNSAKRCARCP